MVYALLVIALLPKAFANSLLTIGASQFRGAADASFLLRLLGSRCRLLGLLLVGIVLVTTRSAA